MKQSRLVQKPWQKGQFNTKAKTERNKNRQRHGACHVIELLGFLTDLNNKELPVEFFFYTNTDAKASSLADALMKMRYTVYGFGLCGYDKSRYSIAGCTPKMKMTDDTMTQWAEQMCELALEYDCDFDGWGTSPDME